MVKQISDFADKYGTVIFKKPTTNKKGYPVVNYSFGTEDFAFQLTKRDEPPLRAPFGVSVYIEKGSSDAKIRELKASVRKNCDLQFRDPALVDALQRHDDFLIEEAIKHKQEWFKPTKGLYPTDDNIRSMFTSSVAPAEQYDPKLRTKVNCVGKKVTKFYIYENGEKKTIAPDDLYDIEFEVIPFVNGSSLWFNSKAWGTTYNLQAGIVFIGSGSHEPSLDVDESKLNKPPPSYAASCSSSSSSSSSTPAPPANEPLPPIVIDPVVVGGKRKQQHESKQELNYEQALEEASQQEGSDDDNEDHSEDHLKSVLLEENNYGRFKKRGKK